MLWTPNEKQLLHLPRPSKGLDADALAACSSRGREFCYGAKKTDNWIRKNGCSDFQKGNASLYSLGRNERSLVTNVIDRLIDDLEKYFGVKNASKTLRFSSQRNYEELHDLSSLETLPSLDDESFSPQRDAKADANTSNQNASWDYDVLIFAKELVAISSALSPFNNNDTYDNAPQLTCEFPDDLLEQRRHRGAPRLNSFQEQFPTTFILSQLGEAMLARFNRQRSTQHLTAELLSTASYTSKPEHCPKASLEHCNLARFAVSHLGSAQLLFPSLCSAGIKRIAGVEQLDKESFPHVAVLAYLVLGKLRLREKAQSAY